MTYHGQVVVTDGELQGHTRHYTYQLKYHIFSFQFLLILPENIYFIGKAEKIGKQPKILLDIETEKKHLWLCNLKSFLLQCRLEFELTKNAIEHYEKCTALSFRSDSPLQRGLKALFYMYLHVSKR